MAVLAYFCAVLMGKTLGLIGGGGSILTVPILVYLMGVDPVKATGYSLFVVGATALVGGMDYFRKGMVNVKAGIIFAAPSFVGVFLVRRFGIPALPDEMFTLLGHTVTKDAFIMLVFALVMLATAYSMVHKPALEEETHPEHYNYPLIAIEGLVVGGVTGLVGAGGGFLIVPALVVLAGLPMKQAVGTSLMIISIKSLFGFLGDLQPGNVMDWPLLLTFTGLAIFGVLLGGRLAHLIPGKVLKPAFGVFVFVMGLVILGMEVV